MSNRIQGKEAPYAYQSRTSFFKFPENSTQKDMFRLKKEFDVLIGKLDETYLECSKDFGKLTRVPR